MTNDKAVQSEIESFISSFLLQQFGERPYSVDAAIRPPFVAVHLKGFLVPGEKLLLRRKEVNRITETRDLLLNGAKPELFQELKKITGYNVKGIYADWNLEKESGLLLIVLDAEVDPVSLIVPDAVDKEAFHDKVISISKKTEKVPAEIESFWLNDTVVLIERGDIMVDIEKELIKIGVVEKLRLAKRPLEHRIIEFLKLEPVLKQEISELFVDWDFEENKSYMVFILEPKSD